MFYKASPLLVVSVSTDGRCERQKRGAQCPLAFLLWCVCACARSRRWSQLLLLSMPEIRGSLGAFQPLPPPLSGASLSVCLSLPPCVSLCPPLFLCACISLSRSLRLSAVFHHINPLCARARGTLMISKWVNQTWRPPWDRQAHTHTHRNA